MSSVMMAYRCSFWTFPYSANLPEHSCFCAYQRTLLFGYSYMYFCCYVFILHCRGSHYWKFFYSKLSTTIYSDSFSTIGYTVWNKNILHKNYFYCELTNVLLIHSCWETEIWKWKVFLVRSMPWKCVLLWIRNMTLDHFYGYQLTFYCSSWHVVHKLF
jgi:hypothetical protein